MERLVRCDKCKHCVSPRSNCIPKPRVGLVTLLWHGVALLERRLLRPRVMRRSTACCQERKRAPALTQRQERELAKLWQEAGDQAARNLLVQSQLGYALTVARRCNRPGTSIDELLAEGSLGLIRAADRFDAERGYRFFTYAKHWVHVYVSRCANRSAVMLRPTRLLAEVKRERARAFSLVGEGAEARGMIAERLNLSDEDVEESLCALDQREVSFEALAPEQVARSSQPAEHEMDPEQQLLQRVDRAHRRSRIKEVLGTLDSREQRIVAQRLMADLDTSLTLEQLGKEFGVSSERVRQLEARLKLKLAQQLCGLREPDFIERELAA